MSDLQTTLVWIFIAALVLGVLCIMIDYERFLPFALFFFAGAIITGIIGWVDSTNQQVAFTEKCLAKGGFVQEYSIGYKIGLACYVDNKPVEIEN